MITPNEAGAGLVPAQSTVHDCAQKRKEFGEKYG